MKFNAKTGKLGVYSVVITVVFLALLIFVNLIVNSLPENIKAIDTTSTGMYTLSETTEKYVSSIEENVTINFICQGGTEDERLATFLGRFASLNPRISIKVVDPIESPKFLTDHNAEGASNFSVVVESEKRSKYIDNSDMFYLYSSMLGKMTYDEYQYYYYSAYSSYLADVEEFFDGQSLITGAIEYVTAQSVPTVYVLSGHNESALPKDAYTIMDAYGILHEELNIALEETAIPDNCSLIIINAPVTDLTSQEASKLLAYLNGGGRLLMFSNAGVDSLKNFASVAAAYGLSAGADIVYEGDKSAYINRATYIIPQINAEHDAVAPMAGYKVVLPESHAILTSEISDVSFAKLLYTTEKAYVKNGEENSEESSFSLATLAEKKLDNDKVGKLIWCGSANMLTDTFVNYTNGNNLYCFWFMVSYMCGSFSSTLPEISATSLAESVLEVSEADVNIWGNVFIFIIPIAVLAGGCLCIFKRKKR